MEREKQLSILYQKQGRATQFASKAARDRWLQKEIDEYERVLSSNMGQVISPFCFPKAASLLFCVNSSLHKTSHYN